MAWFFSAAIFCILHVLNHHFLPVKLFPSKPGKFQRSAGAKNYIIDGPPCTYLPYP